MKLEEWAKVAGEGSKENANKYSLGKIQTLQYVTFITRSRLIIGVVNPKGTDTKTILSFLFKRYGNDNPFIYIFTTKPIKKTNSLFEPNQVCNALISTLLFDVRRHTSVAAMEFKFMSKERAKTELLDVLYQINKSTMSLMMASDPLSVWLIAIPGLVLSYTPHILEMRTDYRLIAL